MEHSIALVTRRHLRARLTRQPACSPPWATARSSSPGAAWPRFRENGRSARGGDQDTGLHAAGAGSGRAVQRSVRPRRSSSSEVSRSISYCSMQGWSQVRSACSPAAGVEACSGPADRPSSNSTVGLLRANLLSPGARIVIAGAEPARSGAYPCSYTPTCQPSRPNITVATKPRLLKP